MAALTVCVCGALQLAFEFADAFIRKGWSPGRSFQHYQARQNQRQFLRNCRHVWIQALGLKHGLPDRLVDELLRRTRLPLANAVYVDRTVGLFKEEMQRCGIDFGAVEADTEAFEVLDNFVATQPRGSTASIGNANDLLDGRQQSLELVDNFYDIEVISGEEVNTSFLDYLDTLPVYEDNNITELEEGISITVTGYIKLHCERFSINFIIENSTRDVALHINPRLPQNYIVRNTKSKGRWGHEDVSSALPFSLHRGHRFSIQVFVTEDKYLISVNGIHFAKYPHRLPYTSISTIEVKGDVEDVHVERSEKINYPERIPGMEPKKIPIPRDGRTSDRLSELQADSPDFSGKWAIIRLKSSIAMLRSASEGLVLPYYGAIPIGSLKTGRCLKIKGRVKLLPHSFYINLQRGQQYWPHPVVAFHFNPRFSKQSGAIGKAIVCRNAWYEGEWAKEERSELDTDFRPGKAFDLLIACVDKAFQVYLNRKIIVEYNYHLQPEIVDTIYIQGDIKLWHVTMTNIHIEKDGRSSTIATSAFDD